MNIRHYRYLPTPLPLTLSTSQILHTHTPPPPAVTLKVGTLSASRRSRRILSLKRFRNPSDTAHQPALRRDPDGVGGIPDEAAVTAAPDGDGGVSANPSGGRGVGAMLLFLEGTPGAVAAATTGASVPGAGVFVAAGGCGVGPFAPPPPSGDSWDSALPPPPLLPTTPSPPLLRLAETAADLAPLCAPSVPPDAGVPPAAELLLKLGVRRRDAPGGPARAGAEPRPPSSVWAASCRWVHAGRRASWLKRWREGV